MVTIQDISRAVEPQFQSFRVLLSSIIKSEHPMLAPVTEYLLKPTGKHIRPLLAMLVARLHMDENSEQVEQWKQVTAAAVLIELIHWSTLVHDDVVDEAYQRRGEWTPSALMRSKSAVLIGDYLFSRGLAWAAAQGNFYAVTKSTATIETIVDGELKQMSHSRKRDTTKDHYFDIITSKTASLISTAAQCGAQGAGASEEQMERMAGMGRLIGLAFQIQDDILDFGKADGRLDDATSGKIVLNDLRESKITLPLILALEGSTESIRKRAMRALSKAHNDNESLGWLRDFVFKNRGIEQSRAVMLDLLEQAIKLLEVNYPESEVQECLMNLCQYIVEREK